MYWLYRTHLFTWRNQDVIAKLVSPPTHPWSERDCGFGFNSPRQDQPYGVDLRLTYQINPEHPQPDAYCENAGFTLYSRRLIDLLRSYGVRCEVFPATMIDAGGAVQPHLDYWVFHSLEGVLAAMDEERSLWRGDRDIGIPRLVLDYAKFEHRPIFTCNHIYVQLMRDDLKQELRSRGITGLDFLAPERFRSGIYGSRQDYDD
ncbi:MAG: hypothetical protein K6V36_00430 [Anaerolineae bacterium]|nr:hypothetical protein [Anaerolineae bacterium]